MTHSPNCGGCWDCDPEMRAAMQASMRGDDVTYCRWLKKRDALRAASHIELRTNVHYEPEDTMEDFTPPNPYAKDLAKLAPPESGLEQKYKAERLAALAAERTQFTSLRAAHIARGGTPRKPLVPDVPATAAELKAFEPPNPYEAGIKALQAQERGR